MNSRSFGVVATIRDAYAFTFQHLGGIIGLIWLPTLMLTVMGFFSSQHLYNGAINTLAGANPAGMGAGFLVWLGYLLSSLLLQAIAFVAVVQLAVGTRDPKPVLVHFAFGPLEWRMFGALMSFTALMLVAFLTGSTVIGAAAGLSAGLAVVALAFYGLLLAAVARMFLLLPAVAVGETAPVLRRVWLIGVGNFGRLFAVLLAIIVPVFFFCILVMVPVAARVPPPPVSADLQAQQMEMMRWIRDALPYLWGVIFLVSPLVVGLFAGASVSAWRALKDEAPSGIVA